MNKPEKTPTEAGLNNKDQILIALKLISEKEGTARIRDIYEAIENNMVGASLSVQGKASLRRLINHDAVNRGYIFPYDKSQPGWHITTRGENYLNENYGLGVEEEEESLQAEDLEIPISQPYDPQRIKVDLRTYSIFQLLRKIKNKEIDLQPEFQRNIVWNEKQQSRLIESVLINLPLPAFYLDASRDECWKVVDGLQRLWTLNRFCNQNNLRLRGLEFLSNLEGKNWDQIPRLMQRRIEDTMLNMYLIQPETPEEAKFTIFARVNTGGMILTSQEIRHAIYQGEATHLLADLAESDEFLSATDRSVPSKRMADRELILRFISFYFERYLPGYKQYEQADWNTWLNQAMKQINVLKSQNRNLDLLELRKDFKGAMVKAQLIFGSDTFRKINGENGGFRFPLNKSLFEVWGTLLVPYSKNSLQEFRMEIKERFIQLLKKPEFLVAISQGTSSKRNVFIRFNLVEQLLKEVVK